MWQPIDTAPKDGTRVLIAHEGVVDIAEFVATTASQPEPHWLVVQFNCYEFAEIVSPDEATHWMPLPKPPAST